MASQVMVGMVIKGFGQGIKEISKDQWVKGVVPVFNVKPKSLYGRSVVFKQDPTTTVLIGESRKMAKNGGGC